jgi:two-component system nitrogen regulation response regulator GlnG
VFEIALPSLCHRVEDIPILAQRFLQRLSRPEMPAGRLTEAALAELCRRRWIGNVRELRNAVEHGALMARGGAISPEHLPPPLDVESARDANPAASLAQAVRAWAAAQLATGQARTELYQRFLAEVEPPLFDSVLDATGQNRAAAAEVLGIHRATLRKKLN